MAKRLFNSYNQTFTASAAGSAVTAATSNIMGITGATTTQVVDVLEVAISGLASASTIGAFQFVPVSTLGTGAFSLAATATDGSMVVNATALASVVSTYTQSATTGATPSSSSTVPRLNVTINMFGGIFRWNAAPTQQIQMIGNAVNLGAWCLYNSSTGGGVTGSANAHIIYEPY